MGHFVNIWISIIMYEYNENSNSYCSSYKSIISYNINIIPLYIFLIVKSLMKMKGILQEIKWLLSFKKRIYLLKYWMGHYIHIYEFQ